MKTTAVLMVGGLAIANAAPNSLKGRAENPGATPADHPNCEATGNNGEVLGGIDTSDLQGYWDDLKNQGTCEVAAGKCNRVTCGNTSAVYVCNDNDFDIAPGCETVAEYVGEPEAASGDGEYHITQSCRAGLYGGRVSGELTFEEGWRIQVAYGNCDHSPDSNADQGAKDP